MLVHKGKEESKLAIFLNMIKRKDRTALLLHVIKQNINPSLIEELKLKCCNAHHNFDKNAISCLTPNLSRFAMNSYIASSFYFDY